MPVMQAPVSETSTEDEEFPAICPMCDERMVKNQWIGIDFTPMRESFAIHYTQLGKREGEVIAYCSSRNIRKVGNKMIGDVLTYHYTLTQALTIGSYILRAAVEATSGMVLSDKNAIVYAKSLIKVLDQERLEQKKPIK